MLKVTFDTTARLIKAKAKLESLGLSVAECSKKHLAWADNRNLNLDFSNMSDHEMWLHDRSLGLGGSDIGALLGISTYTTRYQLWLDKCKREVEFTGNSNTKWGSLLEQTIANNCADTYGLTIEISPPAFVPKVMQWLRCNIDFDIANSTMMGEVKTASAESKSNWGEGIPLDMDMTNKALVDELSISDINDCLFPEAYYCQMQFYMNMMGKSHCLLTVLIGGNDERTYIVKANPEFQQLIRIEATLFMMYNVIDGNPPLLTEFEAMEQLTACDFSGNVEIDKNISAKVSTVVEIKAQIKELDKKREEIEQEIKMFIGEHEQLVNEEQEPLIVWGGYDKTTIDREALEDLHPEIYEELKEVKQVRTLRYK